VFRIVARRMKTMRLLLLLLLLHVAAAVCWLGAFPGTSSAQQQRVLHHHPQGNVPLGSSSLGVGLQRLLEEAKPVDAAAGEETDSSSLHDNFHNYYYGQLLSSSSSSSSTTRERHLTNSRNMSFLSNYVLQYVGCAGIVSVAESSPDDYDDYYPGTKILQMESLVRFALCPRGGDDASKTTSRSSSCSAHSRGRCRTGGGGEYVVRMSTFLQAYTENQLTEEERTCEMVRRSCNCGADNTNNEESCEPNCYAQNGHNECIEYQGQEAFHVQRYLQCAGTYTL
jgi:hypothetical protein